MKKIILYIILSIFLSTTGCGIKFVPRNPGESVRKRNPQYGDDTPAPQKVTEQQTTNRQKGMTKEQKNRLLAELKPFIGAPYVWGGETPSGCDCSGLIMTAYLNAFDIELPHNAAQQYQYGIKVSKSQLAFGDLVFFSEGGDISHAGIYIAKGQFLHASQSKGVIFSKLSSNPYKNIYIGARRLVY